MKAMLRAIVGVWGVIAAGTSLAATCVSSEGYVVPCPTPHTVQAIFQQGTLPKFVGVQADIYITGGGTVDFASNFTVSANGHYLCSTQNEYYSTTPIRHCKGVINAPGTYTISATATTSGQNFNPPANAIINVD
ncbi:hypothetical protein FZ025_10290 [Xanthomonas hyacinthi]|uniref:hypothetical protein n=1 Tax=Xanthomonas hyacinthi TaxID=56455 RepID=UPI0011B06539|nr:hypothetical protein [Xanthomonas hyacinthi]QGY77011.1 hypothetical protein FZ025_10290 [Xanthomonas hyacinthi]